MNQKEKAKELYLNFGLIIQGCNAPVKQCVLIAVNELINSTYSNRYRLQEYEDTSYEIKEEATCEYWHDVKLEIEKL